MKPHVSAIAFGVRDLKRTKAFYAEGLGWPIQMDHENMWLSFAVNGSALIVGFQPWDAMARDLDQAAEASGFRGVTLSYGVRDDARVAEILKEAERAGGKIVKPAEKHPWGGYGGVFADPEGLTWKIASGGGMGAFHAE